MQNDNQDMNVAQAAVSDHVAALQAQPAPVVPAEASSADAEVNPPSAEASPSTDEAQPSPSDEGGSELDAFEKSDEPDEPDAPVEKAPNPTNEHVVLAKQVFVAQKSVKGALGALSLIARNIEKFVEQQNKLMANPEKYVSSEDGRAWAAMASFAADLLPKSPVYEEIKHREKGDIHQYVEHEGFKMGASMPSYDYIPGKKLAGKEAAARMRSAMGLGAKIRIPLWHSGIWVELEAPSDSELLMLDQLISEEKIELAAKTGGMIFSNEGIYMFEHLMNFILDHVIATSLNTTDRETLLRVISLQDCYYLAHGMAMTIYPQGYPLRIPCVENIDKCKHVTEAHVNLAYMLMVDRNALTQEQKLHMAKKKVFFSPDEVLAYQKGGILGEGRRVEITDKLALVLRRPSLLDNINAGHAWVDGMLETVAKALGPSVPVKEKNTFIEKQTRLTFLRQYSHWIERVIYGQEEFEGEESVAAILDVLSTDTELWTKFFDDVAQFIKDTAISFVAITNYPCPACGTPLTPEDAQHPEIYMMDPILLFFALKDQRLILVNNEQMNS
jgi:hypothetical protein